MKAAPERPATEEPRRASAGHRAAHRWRGEAGARAPFDDHRPIAAVQRTLQAAARAGARDGRVAQLQAVVDRSAADFAPPHLPSAGPLARGRNFTGLPAALKAGVERLSGQSLDGVRVHRNSPRPVQLQALAFAQGNDIHLAPGAEPHLPHEAWHVAQQRQGRVKPTLQAKGIAINDDAALEREADVMGARALRAEPQKSAPRATPMAAGAMPPVQRLKLAGAFGLDDSAPQAALKAKIDAFHEARRKAGAAELEEGAADEFDTMLKEIRRLAEDVGGAAGDAVAEDASDELQYLEEHRRLRTVASDGAVAAVVHHSSAATTTSTVTPSPALSPARAAGPVDEISDLSVWAPTGILGPRDEPRVREIVERLTKDLGVDGRLVETGVVALWRAGELPADYGEAHRLLLAPIRLCERVVSIAAGGIKSHAALRAPASEASAAAASPAVQGSSDLSHGSKTHFFDIQHGRNSRGRYPERYPHPGFSSASVASERTDDREQTAHWALRLADDGHADARQVLSRFQAARGDTSDPAAFRHRVAGDTALSLALGQHIRNAPSDSPEKRFLRLLLSGRAHYTAMFVSTGQPLADSSAGPLIGKEGYSPDVRELTSSHPLAAPALTHLVMPEVMRIFAPYLSAHFHGQIIYVPTVSVPAFTYFDAQIGGSVAAGRVLVPDYDDAINTLARGGHPVLTHITRGPPR